MGVFAIFLAVSDRLVEAALFVLLGILFDFFDGWIARLLKVQSELGIQLDSLADVVTSGVVPGIVMFQLFMRSLHQGWMDGLSCEIGNWVAFEKTGVLQLSNIKIHLLPFVGLLLTLAAAYRLAKFNIDDRQTTSFIGLPTPAMTVFVVSLPVILRYGNSNFFSTIILNPYFLVITTVILSFLMNAELPLFSLKFKSFSWKKNWVQLVFLFISILGLLVLKVIAVPFIIIFYVLFSLLRNIIP